MKKIFAIVAMMGMMTFGLTQNVMAQDEAPADSAATEQVEEAAPAQEEAVAEEETPAIEAGETSLHQELKTKFIEGDAGFMSIVAVALIVGLAFCIERIIYLSLADVNVKKLMGALEAKLAAKDIEGAKKVCRDSRGPVASICYQGLMHMDEGLDVVERTVTSYGGVQAGYLERNCSWITLCIAMAPSLGFLGTVVGMVQAFDKIQQVGDISPTVVAGGMKVALITTLFGIIVALILQFFYNFVLSKIEAITSNMEDSSISLLDMITKAKLA